MLYKFARMFHGRLQGAGITAMDFEDVLSEMNVAYVTASQPRRTVQKVKDGVMVDVVIGYDPDGAITFGAYLGRSCMNRFNKIAERLELHQFGKHIDYKKIKGSDERGELGLEEGEYLNLRFDQGLSRAPLSDSPSRHYGLGMISLEQMTKNSSGEDWDLLDGLEIMTDEVPADQRIEARQALQAFVDDDTLSIATRQYVLTIIDPSVKVGQRVMKRIKDNRETIVAELRQRYGVDLNGRLPKE